MSLSIGDLIKSCENSREYGELGAVNAAAGLFGMPAALQALCIVTLTWKLDKSYLVVTKDTKSAVELYNNLCALGDKEQFAIFLPHEPVPFEIADGDPALNNSCIRILSRLALNEKLVVVVAAASLRRKWVPKETFLASHLRLVRNDKQNMRFLQHKLVCIGYQAVSTVTQEGEFCVRGSILDVFPPNSVNPLRIDFFDDEIESIKYFDISTQRSSNETKGVTVAPASLLPLDGMAVQRAAGLLKAELQAVQRKLSFNSVQQLQQEYAQTLAHLEQGIVDPNNDRFVNFYYQTPSSLLDYFEDGGIICCDPGSIKQEITELMQVSESRYSEMIEAGRILPSFWHNFFLYEQIVEKLVFKKALLIGDLADKGSVPIKWQGNFIARSLPVYYNNPQLLQEDTQFFASQGRRIIFTASSPLRLKRLQELISEFSLSGIELLQCGLAGGFDCASMQLVVITEKELLGTEARRMIKRKQTEGQKIDSLQQLEIGDFVVHVNHGIGRYMGVQRLTLDNAARDYLLIEYSGADRLFLPIDQFDIIHKYIGNEGESPKMNKLAGNDWEKAKAKVKKAAAEIAGSLLALYAQREQAQGFAFSQETGWQREFEDSFAYEETPDQLKAWEEIKADMEKPIPMDRLLCGDVGYGKTEVAIRAAFKAVSDGKQVAVLVPTTILAQQHYETFMERFRGFPVSIGVISRFSTPMQQKELLQRMQTGRLDIIIGTHRLLSKDIKFKDLELLIVDEEQRFGVADKEKIKTMKNNIDVLTLTATPIPRTLHMSMVGMRDMSVITTPPEDRLPVQTYVLEYNERVVSEAIMRELSRGGQVFFLHNRVLDISEFAQRLETLVPDSKVLIAHGQMREKELEQVMLDFVENKADILLCTTIIESGLDIPNVNTLIVDNADHLGLSQLYQLRGRVGRSSKQAFAYFTYDPRRIINETAKKRLLAIRDFTQLGSGFRIAMRDMEIRGAGNILGSEQHGHIAAVGFDLYCRLVQQEIERQKIGGAFKTEEKTPPLLELQLKAFIPDDYLLDEGLRLDVYKQIATVGSLEEMDILQEELTDRFGIPSLPVMNLLALGKIKYLAQCLDISSIIQSKNYSQSVAEIIFKADHNPGGEALAALAEVYSKDLVFKLKNNLIIKFKLNSNESVTESLLKLLQKLYTLCLK